MIDPLHIVFEVACDAEHAFLTWTQRAAAWWPKEHTVSREPVLQIIFEPRSGGRIFERTSTGSEHEWGRVTAWDPPHRLAYRWHIATDPANATEVNITFTELKANTTRIDVLHGGWERLGGELGQSWREVNRSGWDGVLPAYISACANASTKIFPGGHRA